MRDTPDIALLNRDAPHAARALRALREHPLRAWRPLLEANAEWITLSTLRVLLAYAHDELDDQPHRSAGITHLVLRTLPKVAVPPSAGLLRTMIEGLAWKEHGNALRSLGQYQRALTAANHAITIFSTSDSFIVDRAAALVLKAHVQHELGRTARGLRFLAEAANIFAECGEDRRLLQTVILRGIIEYQTGAYGAARDTFLAARPTALRLEDRRELARIENNLGHCYLTLGDTIRSWDHLVVAAAEFSSMGMTSELPRAELGIARLLQRHVGPAEATNDLQRIADAFTARGMIVEAATVLLEIATLLARETTEQARVRALCVQLTTLFARTTMPAEAVAALEHLKREASRDVVLVGEVVQVRNFFRHLRDGGERHAFVPGH